MKLYPSLLTFSLLHSIGLASGRVEIRVDRELYGELPKPTPEPLLSRDELKRGAILMETRLGYPPNGTSRRNFALGARQVCDHLEARGSPDAAISFPAAMLVTFCHVPLQKSCPAAPRSIQYVDALSKLAHCSAPFHRFAALTLVQPCAVASAPSATVLPPAVMMARSLAIILRVRILIYFLIQASDLLFRLLSWRYVGSHSQLLMNRR